MTAPTSTPSQASNSAAAASAAAVAKSARSQSERDTKQAPRTRDNNFGGPRLKLSVAGKIDGHHLYWANDDSGEIEQLLSEGFDFVEPAEVNMQSRTSHIVADGDASANRVSRYVGKKADGSALRAYLLKCQDEVWADREAVRLEAANNWDDAIRRNQVQPDPSRYLPKGVTTSIDTSFRKEYS